MSFLRVCATCPAGFPIFVGFAALWGWTYGLVMLGKHFAAELPHGLCFFLFWRQGSLTRPLRCQDNKPTLPAPTRDCQV